MEDSKKPRVVFSGRIKPDIAKKAIRGAKEHKLTRSQLIEKALDYYIANVLPWKNIPLKVTK